jgi:hypothetical protein
MSDGLHILSTMCWATLQSSEHVPPLDDGPEDGVLAGVLDARRRGAAWLRPERLVDAASLIVDRAREKGASALFAASPAGFCAVGVALTLDPGLRLYEPGTAEDVLIVDLAVASTAGIQTLEQRLHATGARTVTVLVVDDRVHAAVAPRLAVIG